VILLRSAAGLGCRQPIVVVAEELHNDEPLRENGGSRKANFNVFAVFGVVAIFDRL